MTNEEMNKDSGQLTKDDVRIELEHIGEGWGGDYDEEDEQDEELLRFTVSRLRGDEWEEVDDASYCTQLPASISDEQVNDALQFLMDAFYQPVHEEYSVKKLGERLSWISVDFLNGQPIPARG